MAEKTTRERAQELRYHGSSRSQTIDTIARNCTITRRRVVKIVGEVYGTGYDALAEAPVEASVDIYGGFSLDGKRTAERKPADSVRNLFHRLAPGRGYTIADLEERWKVSVETLRKHAKQAGCLLYVEVNPGEYVACIVSPETAKKHKGAGPCQTAYHSKEEA